MESDRKLEASISDAVKGALVGCLISCSTPEKGGLCVSRTPDVNCAGPDVERVCKEHKPGCVQCFCRARPGHVTPNAPSIPLSKWVNQLFGGL